MALDERVGLEAVFETGQFQAGLRTYISGLSQANQVTQTTGDSMGFLSRVGPAGFTALMTVANLASHAIIGAFEAISRVVINTASDIIETSASVESAFAGVTKTTDGLVDDFGNVTQAGEELKDGFRDLAKNIPTKLEDIMHVGELAGQLGIGRDALIGFTKTMLDLGVSTNITADEAAVSFARIANIFQVSEEDASEFASRVGAGLVDLGNNFATTERDILNFTERLAGAGQIAGLTVADVLGISAAMSSVGVEAEAGGTAVQKVLLSIQEQVSTGGNKLEEFARVAGLSAADFAQLWRTDAGQAFQLFVEGLGKSGDDAIGILDDLDLKDQRLIRAFLSLAGAGDLLGRALDTANVGFEENTALVEEANKRYGTSESKFTIFKNKLRDIGLTIGDEVLPHLIDFLDQAGVFLDRIAPAIGPALVPFIASLADLANGLIFAVQEGDAFNDFFANVGQRFPALAEPIRAFQTVFQGVIDVFEQLGSLSAGELPLQAVFDALSGQGQMGGPSILERLGFSEDQIAIIERVVDLLGRLSSVLIERLPALSEAAGTVGESLIPILDDLATKVLPFLIDQLDNLVTWLEANGPLIDEYLQLLGDSFATQLAIVGDVISIALDTILPLLDGLVKIVLDDAKLFMQIITGDWAGAWETFKGIWATGGEAVLNAADGFFNGIAGLFGSSLDEVIQTWSDDWDMLVEIVTVIVQKISDAISNWFDGLISSWAGDWEQLTTIVETIVQKISDGVESWWSGFVETWSSNWDQLVEIVTLVTGRIADAITNWLATVGGQIAAGWAGVVEFFTGLWAQISQAVTDGLTSITGSLAAQGTTIGDTWRGIWDNAVAIVTEVWAQIQETVHQAFVDLFTAMGLDFDEMQTRWEKIWADLGLIVDTAGQRIVEAVTGFIRLAGTAISTELATIQTQWAENWGLFTTVINTVWQQISDAVTTAVQMVTTIIAAELVIIQTQWLENWNLLTTILTEVWAGIVETLRAAAIVAVEAVLDFLTQVQELWNTTWTAVSTFLSETWAAITEALRQAAVTVLTGLLDFLTKVQAEWQKAWTAVSTFLSETWNKIATFISTKAAEILTTITTWLDGIISLWEDNWNQAKTIIETIWQKILEAIADKLAEIETAITDQINTVLEMLSDVITDFVEAGENLVQGIIDGMLNKAGELIDAITSLVEDAIAAAKDSLQIDSPSRVMMEIADQTVAGFTKGIEDAAQYPVTAMESIMGDLAGASAAPIPAASIGGRVTNVTHNWQPTVNANYAQTQSPAKIMDDMVFLGMMSS